MKKPIKKLDCHFWCLETCLLTIKTKCDFDWDEFMKEVNKKYPPRSVGKKKLEHKVQIRSTEVLKNLRLMIERKEKK